MSLTAIRKRLVGYWNNASIRAKVFLVFILGSTIPVLYSNFLNFQTYRSQIETMVVDDGFFVAASHAKTIEATLEGYKRTLIPLGGAAPIKGYHLALDNGGTDPVINLSADGWKRQIEAVFLEIAKSDNSYTQLRYIDITGNEIVRVTSAKGVTTVTEESDLQDKSDRYYFTETNKLPTGKVYVSRLDLNRAGSPPTIQKPITPNIRFATPVINFNGVRRGMVVANVPASKIFEALDEHKGIFNATNGTEYVVDQNGFYLKNPDPSKTFGGPDNLDTGESTKKDYPSIANKILSGEPAAFAYKDSLIAYSPVFPYENNKEEFWVVVELTKKGVALKSVEEMQGSLNVMLFGFIGVLGVFFFILSHIARLAIDDVEEKIETIKQLR